MVHKERNINKARLPKHQQFVYTWLLIGGITVGLLLLAEMPFGSGVSVFRSRGVVAVRAGLSMSSTCMCTTLPLAGGGGDVTAPLDGRVVSSGM